MQNSLFHLASLDKTTLPHFFANQDNLGGFFFQYV